MSNLTYSRVNKVYILQSLQKSLKLIMIIFLDNLFECLILTFKHCNLAISHYSFDFYWSILDRPKNIVTCRLSQ